MYVIYNVYIMLCKNIVETQEFYLCLGLCVEISVYANKKTS